MTAQLIESAGTVASFPAADSDRIAALVRRNWLLHRVVRDAGEALLAHGADPDGADYRHLWRVAANLPDERGDVVAELRAALVTARTALIRRGGAHSGDVRAIDVTLTKWADLG